MRSILDELEGVSRSAAGRKSLVFESVVNGTSVKGMYETGYDGAKSVVNAGYSFEREGIDSVVSRGSLSKVGKWAWRDDFQQRLVRQARRLPYEVPAFYAADKFITKPLFGGAEEDGGPKKKWYDPTRGIDLAKDLAKTTLFQMGGFMLPAAAAGAAKGSSINFFKTAEQRIQDQVERGAAQTVGNFKEQIFRRGLNLQGALQEVGHDLASVFDKSVKFGERSSGALASAFLGASGTDNNPVGTLYRQRHGAVTAPATVSSRLKTGTNLARDIYNKNNVGITQNRDLLELIPGYKAVRQGLIQGYKEYKNLGYAQEIIDTNNLNSRFNVIKDDIRRVNKLGVNSSDQPVNEIIRSSIDKIQLRRTSPLSNLVQQYNKQTSKENISYLLHQKEYKDRLTQSLVTDHGMDKKAAKFFTNNLDISERAVKTDLNGNYLPVAPVNRISIAGSERLQNGETFFQDIIDRFNSSKVASGRNISITGDQLSGSIGSVDQLFMQNPLLGADDLAIDAYRNSIGGAFQDAASTSVLSPAKLFRGDFLNKSFTENNGAQAQRTLTTRAANILGINTNGTQESIFNELRLRGIDPNNPAQLRAYLINNNAMKETSSSGIAGFFGLSGLKLDSFLDQEEKIHGRLTSVLGKGAGSSTATQNLIVGKKAELVRTLGVGALERHGQTLSDVRGYFNIGGTTVNFNPIKTGARKALEVIGTETKIPVINVNPLQMFGLKDFIGMSKAGSFQLTPGRAMHPFLDGAEADFYTWHSTGGFLGTKGKLFAHTATAEGPVTAQAMAGSYRPLPVNSSGMIATTAELAAGKRVTQSRTATGFLGKVKERLDYDTEQENSLFRFFGRLVNRQADINNEAVMGGLLKSELDTPFTIGGVGKSKKLVLRQDAKTEAFSLFDHETDKLIANHSQLMESFTRFANTTTNFGTSRKVAQHLLDNSALGKATSLNSADLNSAIMGVSDVVGVRSVNKMFEKDLENLFKAAGHDKQAQEAYKSTRKAFSRLRKFEGINDFSAQSQMFEHSSSIVSRADEYRSEVIRYLTQRHGLNAPDSASTIQEVIGAIDDLVSKGVISSSEKAEAQAAVAGNIFNLGAFETYQFGRGVKNGVIGNPLERFLRSREILNHGTVSSSLDPFTSGTSVSASTSSLNPLGKIHPYFKKNFGMGKYVPEAKVSAFSGQKDAGFSYIPTFSTAAEREGGRKAAFLSASGVHTYGNEKGFSLASVPVSHGFNRLNKFFGSVGAKLDADHFYGPLDLYMRGMNAERVLPAVAIGATVLAVDRTAGGYANKKDDRGERVYSPMLLGGVARAGVEAQSALAGLTPGGMTYRQKKEQMLHGEVAIRKGRFWSLGTTKFEGGKIEYFRPSWYRRFQGGAMFTSDTYGSPMEKLMFYNDFSPLRPIDPYRFERKHYEDRPYPITGEYFSGPFGIAVPILNATVGKILKPQKRMHEQEVLAGLASYSPVGAGGAYMPQEQRGYTGVVGNQDPNISYAAVQPSKFGGKPLKFISPVNAMPGPIPSNIASVSGGNGLIANSNRNLSQQSGSTNTAAGMVRAAASSMNQSAINGQGIVYGPPAGPGIMPAKIVNAGLPIRTTSGKYLGGEAGYRLQETLGIYGFAAGNIRKGLGLGEYDFEPNKSVLQSASKAYGSTRAFWDLNIGGLGDLPLQSDGALGNIEISEVVRRFVPKERTNVNFINPIKNRMGRENTFLPGNDNFIDFTTGDPFTKVKEGELRLPGVGYERFNKLYSDKNGRYGAVNQLDILADVAPYSKEFRALNRSIDKIGLSEQEIAKVGKIRAQLNAIEDSKTGFSPYDNSSTAKKVLNPFSTITNKLRHTDNFINNKFFGERTATEDWERRNVYGSTFPEWQRPVESFIKPIYAKGTQRNPLIAAGVGAIAFGAFGNSRRMIKGLAAFGATTVGGYSAFRKAKEQTRPIGPSGQRERFIPLQRKKELALEEYTDILTYVKNRTAASRAERIGDIESAKQFMAASKRTMYGADLDSKSISQLAASIPKRKRDHFKAMIEAPEEERGRILSTAGRLERRIYEAAWGMPVERKPDLVNYFTRHELPAAGSEIWHPNTNMEHVKIKMGQSMGLEMSQMGFFPQQVKEANLVNPSYPKFGQSNSSAEDVRSKLQRLMFDMGINGNISPTMNNTNPGSVNIMAGVR